MLGKGLCKPTRAASTTSASYWTNTGNGLAQADRRAHPGFVVSSWHAVACNLYATRGCTSCAKEQHLRNSAVDSAELLLQTEELAPDPNFRVLLGSERVCAGVVGLGMVSYVPSTSAPAKPQGSG